MYLIRTLLMLYLLQEVLTENKASFVALVKEDDISYKERISVNLDRNVVQYLNPAHHVTLDSRKIQDFDLGLQMICFPTRRRCFLLQLDKAIYPNAPRLLQSLTAAFIKIGKIVFGENSEEYIENWHMTGNIYHDLTKFGSVIRDFHAKYGYPVYEVKRIPQNAQMLIVDGNRKRTLHRRFLRGKNLTETLGYCDATGEKLLPQMKYGSTQTNGCDWLTFCDAKLNCSATRHVRDRIFFVCLCCPYHYRTSDCVGCMEL